MEQKLERVMEIISKADEIMANEGITEEVKILEKELTEITEKQQNIEDMTFLKKSESEQGYWLKWLKMNTGCGSDYLFYPELIGLPEDASMEQIAEKIIETWNCGARDAREEGGAK